MKITPTLCLVCLPVAVPSFAVSYLNGDPAQYQHDGLSLNASLGYLGGESKEFVYYQGRQLSRLDWKLKNAAIIKAEANYDLLPWLSVNARGWTTLASGSGHMNDYDWQDLQSSHYTDSSSSPATVNEANEFDLSVRGWVLNQQNYKLGAVAGYQENRTSWLASGGTYDYAGTDADDNYDPNAARERGTFPAGKPAVGYRQVFKTPYIGLAGYYSLEQFEFNGLLKYSHWVDATDHDVHYMTNATSSTGTNNGELWAGVVNAGYWVTSQAKLFTEASYTFYPNKHGDENQWDNDDHEYGPGGGGLQSRAWSLTAGMQYLW
ncbi:MAG TPA: omptin family outer membrane protease [Scandinavium sp.]|jgi:plasminogen activator|uniref:omptin family outer membrane protease n=1 Tax=Scandinavium sp. TaxID=2830653 RepID=UPI002E353B4B|nr:omptin family outer membrane protease [Scandinavium sp.]HEX4501792.1 omptin family outer membrane protease [Scandinavium sp.]